MCDAGHPHEREGDQGEPEVQTAPQARKWTQGDKSGVCAVTNAAGLIEALRSSGAVVSDGVSITVKTSRFGKTDLIALMASSTTSAAGAPVLDATCAVVLSVPKEASSVLMNLRSGDKESILSVQTPVTAARLRDSLVKDKWCSGEQLTGIQLNFKGEQIELAEVCAEAPNEELCSLFDTAVAPPLTPVEVTVTVKVSEDAPLVSQLLEHGWDRVLTEVKRLQAERVWNQATLANKLGVSPTLVSQLLDAKKTYVTARSVAHLGKMKPADAAEWARRISRAGADGAEADAAEEKKARAPGFKFRVYRMGDEIVHDYLLRACNQRVKDGGRRDRNFMEALVSRVNSTIAAQTTEPCVQLKRCSLTTWCDGNNFKAAKFTQLQQPETQQAPPAAAVAAAAAAATAAAAAAVAAADNGEAVAEVGQAAAGNGEEGTGEEEEEGEEEDEDGNGDAAWEAAAAPPTWRGVPTTVFL